MEYLNNITENLKKINESNLKWINILERPDLVKGILRLASDRVDFTKFPIEAREEIQQYENLAIREMNNLYRNSSGARIMAYTDSSRIVFKVHLKRKWSYKKMNLWNSSGFDVYEIIDGKYVHRTCVAPRDGKYIFAEQISCREGRFCIYLPTYNCIESLYIGVDEDAKFDSYENDDMLPIIFYGNSVTQGAAASRSGNCFPNIIQRTMGREILNLSCSSCCRGLKSMADVIGKINCYGIVIDYTRNAYNVETFRNSHERFYKWVRAYHPNTRIVLMTSSNFNHWRDYFEFDQIVRTTYEKALERNENVKLLEVMKLFDESEYSLVAVDGSHINDVGMFRVARALTELLQG